MNAQTFRGVRVGRYFDSWIEYLESRDAEAAKSLDGAIRWTNRRERHLSDDVGLDHVLAGVPMRDVIIPARIKPWPTFVLGTGCLSASASARGKARVVERIAAGITAATDDEGLQSFTRRFLDNLARNRSDQPLSSAGLGLATGAQRSLDDWTFIAQTAFAAMLLTRLYGEVLVYSNQVVSDAHREEVEIPEPNAKGWLHHDSLVVPLLGALDVLIESRASAGSARMSLRSLAGSVASAVRNDRRVHRPHVELLTAFTWFILTEDTYVYPDWSDLLLFGAFVDVDENAPAPSWDNSQLKPRTPIAADGPVAGWLTSRLWTITQDSWRSRSGRRGASGSARGRRPPRGSSSPRAELYDAVAAILGQQADNYHGIRETGAGAGRYVPPLPSCFVTTLDLELEMAMWQRSLESDTPRPFIVILPVVQAAKSTSVSLGWVWREILPDPNDNPLHVLRGGAPGAWRLLDRELPPTLKNDPEHEGRTPLIVRLAGSPLMNVAVDDVKSLRQALLLDEYTALCQTVLDLTATREPTGMGGGDQNIFTAGLPAALTSSKLSQQSAYMPRYWMFLGAQLSDTGVRLRLLANQIMAAHQNSQPGDVPLGVAINRRSRPADRDVFHWYGLDVVRHDVVQSSTHSLAADLRELHVKLEVEFGDVLAKLGQARREGSAE